MNRTWKQSLMTLPGVGAAILPKLACPACWPAYAALLSSVGLGFLISTVYLLPLPVALLSLALGAIAFRAKQRIWIRTSPAGIACYRGCPARQVCVGIKTHHVQRIRVACCRFVVECVAAPRP